jgi:hypothetical protein
LTEKHRFVLNTIRDILTQQDGGYTDSHEVVHSSMVTSLLHEIDHMAAMCSGIAKKDGLEEVPTKGNDSAKAEKKIEKKDDKEIEKKGNETAAKSSAPKSALVAKLFKRSSRNALHDPSSTRLPDGEVTKMAESANKSMVHLNKVI